MATRAAQTYLLRTQLGPARSLTQDAPFQFLEQFIIQALVCVSAHITRILLRRGSGFEPGVLSSCGETTVITLSASRTEHPSRKAGAFKGRCNWSTPSSILPLLLLLSSLSLRLHQAGPNVILVEMRALLNVRISIGRLLISSQTTSVRERQRGGWRRDWRFEKKKQKEIPNLSFKYQTEKCPCSQQTAIGCRYAVQEQVQIGLSTDDVLQVGAKKFYLQNMCH